MSNSMSKFKVKIQGQIQCQNSMSNSIKKFTIGLN
jgi:hypothetical protein